MTKTTFMAICGEYLIDPALALENDDVREAIREGEDKLREVLQEVF